VKAVLQSFEGKIIYAELNCEKAEVVT